MTKRGHLRSLPSQHVRFSEEVTCRNIGCNFTQSERWRQYRGQRDSCLRRALGMEKDQKRLYFGRKAVLWTDAVLACVLSRNLVCMNQYKVHACSRQRRAGLNMFCASGISARHPPAGHYGLGLHQFGWCGRYNRSLAR